MSKEVIAAIVTGIVLGVIVAFGVWRANVAFKPGGQNGQSQSSTPAPEPTQAENSGITIAKPQQNQVVLETPVIISGITRANSWVAISTEEEDYILKSDENGEFEQKVELVGGVNQLVISAFDEEGDESKSNLLLVYSTEFKLPGKPTPTSQEEGSEDSVSEKVQEKIREASILPLAYLGTITDIADTTIQTKTLSGEISQVSVNDDTEYVKINDKTKKIEFADVAIGDFIVAMGYKDENDVLETTRLLVTEPVSPPERKVIYGEVLEAKRNELTVRLADGDEINISKADKLVVENSENAEVTEIDFSDINQGDTIIATGTNLEPNLEARKIMVIAKAPEASESPTPTPEE